MAEICEAVPGRSQVVDEYAKGVWLGTLSSSDEHLIGTLEGRTVARSVVRRPDGKRWSKRLPGAFVGGRRIVVWYLSWCTLCAIRLDLALRGLLASGVGCVSSPWRDGRGG